MVIKESGSNVHRRMYVCMYVCIYVCMYACMYVSTHMAGNLVGWANFYLGCMNGLGKRHSHLVGGSFLAVKAILVSKLKVTTSCEY